MVVRPSMSIAAASSSSSPLVWVPRSPLVQQLASRVLRRRLGLATDLRCRRDLRVGLERLLLGIVGELLRLAMRLLGGRAGGLRRLLRELPGLGEPLRRLRHQLARPLLILLGLLLCRLGVRLRVALLLAELLVRLLPRL